MTRYRIDNEDLGVEGDRIRWTGFILDTWGDTREEMLSNATICEIDQDGGEVCTHGYGEYSGQLDAAVEREVDAEIARADREYDAAPALTAAVKLLLDCVKRGDLIIRPDQDPSRSKGAHAYCANHALEKAKRLVARIEKGEVA